MTSETSDWWKRVPCHFNWDLEDDVTVDFTSVVNNLDSKLESLKESNGGNSSCVLLLFRGYLEVSKFAGVTSNPEKANAFFDQADSEAEVLIDDEERRAYVVVSSANRLWVLEKFKIGSESEMRRKKEYLVSKLEENWQSGVGRKSGNFDAYLEAVAAFALTRLGPYKYREAESRYRKAIKLNSKQAEWFHALGELVGRQARQKTQSSGECYSDMDEEIRCYQKALDLDPENDFARCDLALVLARKDDKLQDAKDLIALTKDVACEVIIKKGRFYRRQKDFQKALAVLKKGTKLQNPRSELFFQISLVCSSLASQAGYKKNYKEKTEYLEKEMEYLDKCIQREPSHFFAKLNKARNFSKSRRNEEAEQYYRKILNECHSSPRNLIEAQFTFAEFLTLSNRGRIPQEAADLYEEMVNTGAVILREIDQDGNAKVTGKDGFLEKARNRLKDFYLEREEGSRKMKELEEKLSTLGI